MAKTIDEALEQVEKDNTIFCPHCSSPQEDFSNEYPVTLDGSDVPTPWVCQNPDCGKDFVVHEVVHRYYHSVTREEHERGDDAILMDKEVVH